MKTLHLTMAVLMAIATTQKVPAQTTTTGKSGLYLTAGDFMQNKLSYEIDCSGGDKLRLHALFGSPVVTIIQNGHKKTLPKNQLYGYRDCHNRNYRFVNNEAYLVKDTAGYFVYYNYKLESGPTGKGWVKSDNYYFSATAGSPLELLTADNLKTAFPGNPTFQPVK